MTTPLEPSPVGLLVLARLLVAGEKGATLAQVRKDVGPTLEHRWAGATLTDRLDGAMARLEASEMIARSKKGKTERAAITTEGRRRALEALGLSELPAKATWAALKKTHLLARALDLPAPTGAAAKAFGGDAGFKAALLKRRFDLPIADFPTPAQAADALAWSLLGFPTAEKLTLKALQARLFGREAGDPRAADPKKALDRLLARAVGARRDHARELREAALRGWVDSEPEEPAPAAPIALDDFARRALLAARSSPTGRFGDDKVFIAHAWRAARNDPALATLDLDEFKRRLVDAQRLRLLDLARADLVEAMDPDDVRSSETHRDGAVFHFLRLNL